MNSTSKIWTIIAHEYLLKVRTRAFALSIISFPIIVVAFFAFFIWMSSSFDKTEKKLAILDKSGLVADKLIKKDIKHYYLTNESESSLQKKVKNEEIDGYAIIPEKVVGDSNIVRVYSKGGGGTGFIYSLKNNIKEIVKEERLISTGASKNLIDLLNKDIKIDARKISENGKIEKDSVVSMALVGYVMGFAIYILIFLYGTFISRGVIEEKSNRIIEIIASSVKPLEILLGKVIGIGAVGLTQVLVWILLIFAGITIAASVSNSKFSDKKEMVKKLKDSRIPDQLKQFQDQQEDNDFAEKLEIPSISPWLVVMFVFNFLMGYFIFGVIFAAFGSAVDNEQDAAQLQMPITFPIIIISVCIPQVMANPDSTLSIFMSIFPISAPIIMTTRMAATSVPLYQIISSIVLELGAFFGLLWMAGKIYKIGILSTGKKPSFKDLIKWIRMS